MMSQSVRVFDTCREGLLHTAVREGFLRRRLELNLEEKDQGRVCQVEQQGGTGVRLELSEGGEGDRSGALAPLGTMGTTWGHI